MSNAIRPGTELRLPALPSEQKATGSPTKINRLKPSSQALRELWGDLLAIASIGVCAWLLLKTAFQLWR